MQRARGQLEHLPLGEALRQVVHRGNAPVGVALGLLELLDGLADLPRLEVKLAQLEPDLQVRREPLRALLALGQLVGLLLGLKLGGFVRVVRRARIQQRHLVVELPHHRVRDAAVQRRVAADLRGLDLLVVAQRAVELLLLRAELRQGAQQLQVLGLGLEPRLVFVDQPLGHVFRFDLAILLLQRDGFLFVLQNVAIGAGAVGQRLVAAFVQRLARGKVFERLRQFVVGREGAIEVRQDLLRPPHLRRRPPAHWQT